MGVYSCRDTVNLLLERLRLIEQRLPKKNSEIEALLAKPRNKKQIEPKIKEHSEKRKKVFYML